MLNENNTKKCIREAECKPRKSDVGLDILSSVYQRIVRIDVYRCGKRRQT